MAPPIYARGIARIVALTETGEKHVGMAIVVDDRHVMTCCHVLNEALNAVRSEKRDRLDPTRPPEGTRFEVRFPFAANAKGDGGVVEWGLELESPKDVAVLELKPGAPAEADVAEFSRADVPLNKAWLCNRWSTEGTERGAGGTFGPILSNGELQLNGPSGVAVRIAEGYSGAGVWSGDLRAFVGMVVTKDRDQFENGLTYAIPTSALLQVWHGLQLDKRLSSADSVRGETDLAATEFGIKELIAWFEYRANKIRSELAAIPKSYAVRGNYDTRSNCGDRYLELTQKFEALHRQHLEYIQAGRLTVAHEVLHDILDLLREIPVLHDTGIRYHGGGNPYVLKGDILNHLYGEIDRT